MWPEEWQRFIPWALPILSTDRLSENVEDRRGQGEPAPYPSPTVAPFFNEPAQRINPWEPTVTESSSPDRTQGMLPPLADFLKGSVPLTNQVTGEMNPLTGEYLDRVKKFEGFNPKAYPDYKQWSIGYGTRARSPGETIDRQEGEKRLTDELLKAEGYVKQLGVPMSPRQQDALTDLTYNAGPGWRNWQLGQAVKAGDWQRAAQLYRQTATTVNNGQKVLPGLVNRRASMAPWLLNSGGEEMATVPAQPFFQEDPRNAPQGVTPSLGGMMQAQGAPPQGVDPSQMMRPAPVGTPPEAIKSAWNNYFSAPEVQGALINMAIEAMRPRWNSGSLMPDVLNAGLRTIGAQETYDDKLFKEQAELHNKELDRESRERMAGMAADSRLEVAEARTLGALAGLRERDRLKQGPMWQKMYKDFIDQYIKMEKLQSESLANIGKPPKSSEQIEAEAKAYAQRQLDQLRGMFDTGPGAGTPIWQGENSAGADAPGQAAPGGTGGSPRPVNGVSGASGGAGKTTPQVQHSGTETIEQIQSAIDGKMGAGAFEKALSRPEFKDAIMRRLTPEEQRKLQIEHDRLRSMGR